MKRTYMLSLAALMLTTSFAGTASADRIDSPNAEPAVAPVEFKVQPVKPRPPNPDPKLLMRARLTKLVLKRRQLQIERLRLYRMRGLFPRNTYANKILRVLVDKDGRFCAVANLIALDGKRLMVLQEAKKNRFVNFKNVHSGALFDWVLSSGLTKAEIVAIQLPDSRIGRRPRPDMPIVTVKSERQRLIRHLFNVERQLLAQQTTSVNTIVDAMMKQPKLIGQLFKSLQFTNKQPI